MLLDRRPVTRNKDGAQVYFRAKFASQHSFPLPVDGECVAQLIPHTAVILWPPERPPEYPITVSNPGVHASETGLQDVFDSPRGDK